MHKDTGKEERRSPERKANTSARPHLAKPIYFGLFGLPVDPDRSFDDIYSVQTCLLVGME